MAKELSQEIKKRIINLHKSGLGYRKMSKMLGIPVSTIGTIIRKWKVHNTTSTLPRSGR
uniref:Sleeping Beauty transposase HTH domain-containing protein n=1 Tax=Acanthochromis polyacanthus TaxID=80966 RepID=A0A3Q1EZX4_9TELE